MSKYSDKYVEALLRDIQNANSEACINDILENIRFGYYYDE